MRKRFTCPSGAVWDIQGLVIKNPDPAQFQDDSLVRNQVATAYSDVLVELPSPPLGRITRTSYQVARGPADTGWVPPPPTLRTHEGPLHGGPP